MLNPTQTGQNVIAFTVNGQQHVYKGITTWTNLNGISFSIHKFSDSSMVVDMGGVNTVTYRDAFEFIINIKKFQLNSDYPMGNIYPYYQSEYDTRSDPSIQIFYYVDSTMSLLTFSRLDSLVAAGTFQYYGTNSNGQVVTITDGFFDITNPLK